MQLITKNAKTGWCFNTTCETWSTPKEEREHTCRYCYAERLTAFRPNVRAALKKKTEIAVSPGFADKFLEEWQKRKLEIKFFRWHSLGELRTVGQLKEICEIAHRLPDTKFYLPTRRVDIVRDFLSVYDFPANLIVRTSDREAAGLLSTKVVTEMQPKGFHCPTTFGGAKTCDENHCRACWNPKVALIVYKQH